LLAGVSLAKVREELLKEEKQKDRVEVVEDLHAVTETSFLMQALEIQDQQ
jgi:hypothetical protein